MTELRPAFFVDNNEAKWGCQLWGIEIISPCDINRYCTNPVIVIALGDLHAQKEIIRQLLDMNLKYYIIDKIILGRHKKELLEVYDLLETEYSKEVFSSLIISRSEGKEVPEEYVEGNQYFAKKEFILANPKEIFIDCGAYVGDTMEQYVQTKGMIFDKIYLFVPDDNNLRTISNRVDRLRKEWGTEAERIHVIKGVLGAHDGEVCINDLDMRANIKVVKENTSKKVKMYSIDSYFTNLGNAFIKADIEGSEMEMLRGAAKNIKKYKPLLALSIYHKAEI